MEFVNQKKLLEYFPMFITEKYLIDNLTSLKIDFSENSFKQLYLETRNDNYKVNNLSLVDNKNYNYQMILNGKIIYTNEIQLQDDEILINLSLYNKLFNEISYIDLCSYFIYNDEGEQVCSYNFNHINESLEFGVNQLSLEDDLFQLKDKKIIGIVIKDYELNKNDGFEIYTNEKTIKNNCLFSNVNNDFKKK